jgi:predicted MFS family arabinose efflux permease
MASAFGMLRSAWVRFILGITFLEGIVMFGGLAYVGAELHERFGISLTTVGAMLAAFGAGALFYSANAGMLVPRYGQSGLAAAGAISLSAGYATLALMPWVWLAPPGIALIGLGFYMLHNTLQTNATQMVPEARGLAISLFALSLFSGQSVGVALAAPVMDRYGGRPIFLVASVVILVIGFWFRRRLVRHTT